jgi:hypothetical protein
VILLIASAVLAAVGGFLVFGRPRSNKS